MEQEKPECPQKSPYVCTEKAGKYFWCACGKSSRQPYCDGSHAGSGIRPIPVVIEEERKVAWCGCKQSAKGAFCDGTHAKI